MSQLQKYSFLNRALNHTDGDLRFHRNLHDWELDNFAHLTAILDHVHLNGDLADIRIWDPDTTRRFSSKSAFGALQQEDGIPEFCFYKYIWKSSIPGRIKFFAWSL